MELLFDAFLSFSLALEFLSLDRLLSLNDLCKLSGLLLEPLFLECIPSKSILEIANLPAQSKYFFLSLLKQNIFSDLSISVFVLNINKIVYLGLHLFLQVAVLVFQPNDSGVQLFILTLQFLQSLLEGAAQ